MSERDVRFDHYLSKSAELKVLCEFVRRDFSTKGLIHHSWDHVLRDNRYLHTFLAM